MAAKKTKAPKKMPSRSKPSKALAEALKRENNATVLRNGTVTAVRWDGTVNLIMGGVRYLAVPCAQSYADRKTGDRVRTIMHGGSPFVLGAIGGDPDAPAPEFFSTQVKQFTWGRNDVFNQEIRMFVNEGDPQRVGRPGTKKPVYPGDIYYRVLYSYWDGAANVLNGPADTVQSIDLFVGRDDWDEGDPGPANLVLYAHKMDGLPDAWASILYQTTLEPSRVTFTLEAGEMKVITLPDTWRDNIGATTLDSNSIRGFAIQPWHEGTVPLGVLDNSYAVLSEITAGVRVYTQ